MAGDFSGLAFSKVVFPRLGFCRLTSANVLFKAARVSPASEELIGRAIQRQPSWVCAGVSLFFIGISTALLSLSSVSAQQSVLTLREAEFRNRWSGPQEDRVSTPQYFEPGGGLDEPAPADQIDADNNQPSFEKTLDQLAEKIQRGLRFGPLDFQLGLSSGWEYSSQNSFGDGTDFTNSNSLFAAPTVGVLYQREVGVWNVSARYGAGYRYYFNPDYTAAGTGNQRNPLSMTAGVDVGYNTSRLTMNLNASASSGTGYDPVAGANNWQTSTSTGLSARYIISDELSAGGALSGTYSNTADAQVAPGETSQPNSNTLNAGASLFTDYMVTPKTNVRLLLSAGEDLQDFEGGISEGRRYYDSMLLFTYQLAPKLSVDAGGGAGYVQDQNIPDPKYTGLRPVYTAGINYTPTEKTFFKAKFGMQGADVKPNFSLVAGWDVREKTRLSLSVYQNQGFSSLSPDQYNVTRGILGTVAQRLFKGINFSLSAGYEQSEYVSLTNEKLNNPNEGPASYWLANASIYWRLREWLGWQNTMQISAGQGSSDQIQTTVNTSLNLTF